MKIIPEFHEFADQQTLCEKLSQRICAALQKAIVERGKASLVVSGGSTPVPLFTALSEISIKWDSVLITLADERWVEVSDKDSMRPRSANTFYVIRQNTPTSMV